MKDNFNILIVEDELIIAEMTKEMLLDLKYSVVGIAKNHNEAQTYLSKAEGIDMVILDINLEDEKNGIDIGKDINERNLMPFIYLTSYSDPKTIKKAISTTPAAYLLKPFTKSDLYTTIEVIKARNYQKSHLIVVKEGNINVRIESKDVLCIKSDNNYLELITSRKKYIVRNSLENFLEELSGSNFIRIHRSYAANILKIDAINGQYVIIGNEKFPISRKYKNEVLTHFSTLNS